MEEVRMDENELKERLLRESEDFKRIFEEHRQHEERLRLFQKKSFLSEQEKLEEVELKKRKLALKDKMYQMMAEYQKSR
jgi:uncharacterized protein YdcH (DUF465 family)